MKFQKLLRAFLHVCETVAYAHSRGVIHRDLKPANVLLGPFGETLVVDWGLARVTGRASAQTPEAADSPPTPAANWSDQLTPAGAGVLGTPAFMSPEQATGAAGNVGPAADVYGLGATLYLLLTGRAPFDGIDAAQTVERVAIGNFPRPREINRAIPRSLQAICLKAMALRPGDRYASPRALASDLEHWLADEPVTALRETPIRRLARWGRRYRTGVVAALAVLLMVTIVSLATAIRINGERLRADRERLAAQSRSARLAFDRGTALIARRVRLWQVRPQRLLRELRSATGRIKRLAFTPDGKRLLAGDSAGCVSCWDADDGRRCSI